MPVHSKGYFLPCTVPETRYVPKGLGLNRLKCRGKSPTFLGDSPIATFEGLLTNIFSGCMQTVRLYATPGPEGTSTGFTLLHRHGQSQTLFYISAAGIGNEPLKFNSTCARGCAYHACVNFCSGGLLEL